MKFIQLDMYHSWIEIEGLIIELVFLNGFELLVDWNFSEVAILVQKICSASFYSKEVINSFEFDICSICYVPQLNWN